MYDIVYGIHWKTASITKQKDTLPPILKIHIRPKNVYFNNSPKTDCSKFIKDKSFIKVIQKKLL